MANLGKVVYLTEEQKNTLFTNNYITVNGRTIVYNDNDLYLTPLAVSGGGSGAVSGVKGDNENSYRIGNVNITKENIGLSNVENKSSATIRGELTDANVINALGYTPYDDNNPNGYTNNIGTITGILMNGNSMGTSGVVNLGTVLTSHQDISGKANLNSPSFIGTPLSITPTSTSDDKMIATKEYVDNILNVANAVIFKGGIAAGDNLPAANRGDLYRVTSDGKINGIDVWVGDTLICNTDNTNAATPNNWLYLQTGDGTVIGPTSSTAGHIAVFTGNTGKGISDSGFTIATSVPVDAVFTDTDTKVTSAANHYTPASVSGQDKTASASGATAAWSIDVVKGITLNTDGKGHVTGISVTSGKIPSNPNTDRYVNSISFADDTSNNANSPVKLTLTRAGSDTAAIVGNLPKVSSSSAGVVPKGASVSAQSQSTKFLREDGTWAAPSYTTNTDTQVISADYHYTPATVSGQDKTASASGAIAAWGIDVVKGITLNTDGKGHVTGISVTSGKIPGSPINNLNSDSTTESLSAAQGKVLRELIESQAGNSSGGGSLTTINTGVGLIGGPISTSGTIKANLNSETSLGILGTTDRLYPIGVDSNGKLAVNVPWVDNNTTYSNLSASSGGTDVSLVTTGDKYNWNNKQSKITTSGILKGDGSGSISAATAGTDYATPAQVNAKYTKPSSGIPKSDLESTVQTSLNKADTALQNHQTVLNEKATLAWGTAVKIATIGDTEITVALPNLPVYTGAGTWE